MVWLLFATPLERADTLEATDLNNYAPPLYSTDRVAPNLSKRSTNFTKSHEATRTNAGHGRSQ
ncbi:MAG: hypothetical protein ABI596_15380 [Pyrinomonadaceae bacterium]